MARPPSHMTPEQARILQEVIRAHHVFYTEVNLVATSEAESKRMVANVDRHIERIRRVYDEYRPPGFPPADQLATQSVTTKALPTVEGGKSSPIREKRV